MNSRYNLNFLKHIKPQNRPFAIKFLNTINNKYNNQLNLDEILKLFYYESQDIILETLFQLKKLNLIKKDNNTYTLVNFNKY